MREFVDALDIVLQSALEMPFEKISFDNALDRVLAEDIVSDIDMPPFDKSAMDGFACKREELKQELEIIETIAAGQIPQRELQEPLQSAGISTHVIGGADVASELDAKRAIDQGSRLAAQL